MGFEMRKNLRDAEFLLQQSRRSGDCDGCFETVLTVLGADRKPTIRDVQDGSRSWTSLRNYLGLHGLEIALLSELSDKVTEDEIAEVLSDRKTYPGYKYAGIIYFTEDPNDRYSHTFAVLPRRGLTRGDRRRAKRSKTYPVFDPGSTDPRILVGIGELTQRANADIQDGRQVVTALVVRRK